MFISEEAECWGREEAAEKRKATQKHSWKGAGAPKEWKTSRGPEVTGAVVSREKCHPHQQTSCPFISPPFSHPNSGRGWKPSAMREGGYESKNNKNEEILHLPTFQAPQAGSG